MIKENILDFFKKYILDIVIYLFKNMFKLLKVIYFKYILRLFNTCFDTIVILCEKFSSVIFLLCLVVIVCFCLDLGYAIFRTMQHFYKNGTLEVSSMIMDSKIVITCVSVYGAKSLMRKLMSEKKETGKEKNV